ncbi:MAG: GDSL-type esterase/lipase family protein [Campylobacterota bacterium]|nr:GDSL-type esterase/lipase family protein [Campylobacterota bacterium]
MKNIIMLGDSLSFRNDWNSMLKREDIINKGSDGDTSSGLLYRLDRIALDKVRAVCIMIGINDIGQGGRAKEIFERYEMIVRHFMKHNIELIIQSTLYVSELFYEYESINGEVDLLNRKLKALAKKHDIVFLDVNIHLSTKGALQGIYTHDGVHLNARAYEVWSRYLYPLL